MSASRKTAIMAMDMPSCSTVYNQTLAPKPMAMKTSESIIKIFLRFSIDFFFVVKKLSSYRYAQ